MFEVIQNMHVLFDLDLPIRSSWQNLWTVHLEWQGVFISHSHMVYEVNIGNKLFLLYIIFSLTITIQTILQEKNIFL